MSDTLEQELRSALAERAAGMPAAADAIGRLGQVDYCSSSSYLLRWLPPWLPVWPALGGAAAALAAGVATAVVLLSSGTTAAYAGWMPVPTTPTAAVLATMKTACERDAGPLLSTAMTGELMLADQRGSYIAALYANGADAGVCFWGGGSVAGGSGTDEQFHDPPGPDQLGRWSAFSAPAPGSRSSGAKQSQSSVQHLLNSPFFKDHPAIRASLQSRFRAMPARGVGTDVYGRAGSDVAAVSFIIYGGVTVQATVKNGWYFAWWPGSFWWAGVRTATSVTVTTRSGTTISSPASLSACRNDAQCVFAGGNNGSSLPGAQPAMTVTVTTTNTTTTATASTTGTTPAVNATGTTALSTTSSDGSTPST